MTERVVLDADFLSAFLKIERLSLARDLYRVEMLYVPPAVYREVALTTLLPRLVALPWITVEAPHAALLQTLRNDSSFAGLGLGEQEAIAFTLGHRPDAVLLMNDKRASRLARSLGANLANIPAFLLACKLAGLLDRPTMLQVVADLQTRDYYGFRQDVLDLLLA